MTSFLCLSLEGLHCTSKCNYPWDLIYLIKIRNSDCFLTYMNVIADKTALNTDKIVTF